MLKRRWSSSFSVFKDTQKQGSKRPFLHRIKVLLGLAIIVTLSLNLLSRITSNKVDDEAIIRQQGGKNIYGSKVLGVSDSNEVSDRILGLIEDVTNSGLIVRIPTFFRNQMEVTRLRVLEDLEIEEDLIVNGGGTFLGNLNVGGIIAGSITADNVIYSLTAGDGVSISDSQTPTITNDDKGSSQSIFKKIKTGDDTIEADGNDDTLEFIAGDGISLSSNTSDDKLTISNSQLSGLIKSSSYAIFGSGITRLGLGTSTPSNILEINSGVTDTSGFSFTRLTSSSTAGIGGGKVLSVDSGGKVILVSDQTGDTPTAESVLPSATSGMTLYFNGTNWTASNNLFHDGGSIGISNSSPTSRLHVNTNLASKIGIITQGYTAQTANLQEWRDSSGNVLSYVDSNGIFNGSANTSGSLNPGFTTGSVAFQGASGLSQDNSNFFWDDTNNRLGIGTVTPDSQLNLSKNGFSQLLIDTTHATANAQIGFRRVGIAEWQFGRRGSDGSFRIGQSNDLDIANAFTILTSSKVGIGTTTPGAKLQIDAGTATTIGQIIKAASSQTANLTEWQNSSGTILAKVEKDGNIWVNPTDDGLRFQDGTSYRGKLAYNSTTSSLTLSGPSGTKENWRVNSSKNLIGGISTANTKTADASLHVFADTDQRQFIVQANDTQTANLTEWQNSSGTVLSAIDENGYLGIGTSNPSASIETTGDLWTNSGANRITSTGFTRIGGANHYLAPSGSNLELGSASSTGLALEVNGGTVRAMTIDTTGNIGVGTTSPTSLLHLNSVATSLSANGLSYTNWNPASASSFAGDLVGINVGANGTVGSLFNITDNGSSIFKVTQSKITSALPHEFTTAGDVSLGYDLEFTNSTVANIKSNSSLYLQAGPSYASSDIVLQTNNSGNVVVDSRSLNIGGGVTRGLLTVDNTYRPATGKSLVTLNQLENQDIFSASASGTTRMVLTNGGKLGIGTTTPLALLSVAGDLNSNTATMSANYAASTALTVNGGPSANTTHIVKVRNNSGTTLMAVDGYGRTSVKASGTVNTDFMVGGQTGNDNLSDTLVYFLSRTSSQKGLVIRAASSQTANLQEWQDNSGTVLTSIGSNGKLYAPSGSSGSPSYSFGANTNTGISLAATNTIGFVTGGNSHTLGSNGILTLGNTWGTGGDVGIKSGSAGSGNLDRQGQNFTLSSGESTGNGVGSSLIFKTSPTGSLSGTSLNTLAERMRIDEAGKVGIGTTSPATALHVKAAGTGTIATFESDNNTGCTIADNGTISCSSDARFKDNVASITEGLVFIDQLDPSTFTWKNSDGEVQAGFIAQSVESVIPNLVITNNNGYKSLNMTGMIPYVVKAIQEQQTEIKQLGQVAGTSTEEQTIRETWIDKMQGVFIATAEQIQIKLTTLFAKPVEFADSVLFNKTPVNNDKNQAGKAIIPKGGTYVTVEFTPELELENPLVSITATNTSEAYLLEDVTNKSFTIRLLNDAKEDNEFTWLVSLVKEYRTVVGPTPSPTPTPAESVITDPTPTPSPQPTTEPVATESAQTL